MKSMRTFDFPVRWAALALVTGLLLLSGVAEAVDERLKTTGQTTCYDPTGDTLNEIPCAGTGQYGDIQAGKHKGYTDQGNSTILDLDTRLIWEKKSWDGSIHDQKRVYSFGDAFKHADTLNHICAKDESVSCSTANDCKKAGVGGKCGFGGRQDWRVPNLTELRSIISAGTFEPAVPEVFNTNCVEGATVLTGSCTEYLDCHEQHQNRNPGGDHWSSTSFISDPRFAQSIGFDDGSGPEDLKERNFCVRAVAGFGL